MSQLTSILDSIFKTNGGTTRQWRNANEILLTHTEEAKKYVSYMKNKIRDLNKNTQLLALDFLDYSIDDGKIPLWTQVGSKEFLSLLVNIYKTRNDIEVQTKILYLIQKWANKFQKYNTIIPNFTSFYENLKNNDVEFPDDMESTYEKYLQGNQGGNNNSSDNNKYQNKEINSDNKNYVQRINVDLRTSSYERKYKRLVNKLDDWTQQIQDANVFMDLADENGFDDELRGICSDLETGKNQLVDTIESGKLKDEKLMQISLNVQDDIEMTLKRWNDVKNGRKPESFKSSFFKDRNNNGGYNKNNFNNNSGNNQNNKGGFDLLGFDDDFGGNNNNSNTGNNNNLGNDLFDVFSGNNNINNNINQNNFNNNQNNDFFNNMGNNNNNQNNNQNLFGNNNNNINFSQNNQNVNNQNFFNNNNNMNQNNINNQNFFGNNNNNINQNQNQQNQNAGNNDLFSQIFNNNNTNTNNNNFNNLQNNLNSVYNETNQFGINFSNNMPNNNTQNNSKNDTNFNNIMSFNNNNFNFNDNNQNNKNASNKDFVFNF